VTRWLSFHLFHAGDHDRLIAEGVLPLMQRLRGSVKRYFFLRYWNGGTHLRLRLDCAGDPASVITAVRADLGEYLARHAAGPLSREDYERQCARMAGVDASMAAIDRQHRAEAAESLQPADSVQLRTYTFDAARYGGPEARALTEDHFWRSSELAAAVVTATLGRLGARVSLALQFITATASVIETQCDAAATLDGVAQVVAEASNAAEMEEAGGADVHEIVDCVRSGRRVPYQSPAVDALVRAWRDESAGMLDALLRLREANGLSIPPHLLLIDYLHLLDNRLGVTVGVECHLYRVVAAALATAEVN
jgi:thiopeptide-type bacteriocin biosynthesis protein